MRQRGRVLVMVAAAAALLPLAALAEDKADGPAADPADAMAAKDVPNEYGGQDIAGAGLTETFFEDVEGWTVLSVKDARHGYCVAESGLADAVIRVGYDGGQWQVAVQHGNPPDWTGFFDVDGWNHQVSGTARADWTIARIGPPELNRLQAGRVLTLDVGDGPWRYSLSGSDKAIDAVMRCARRYGYEANFVALRG